MWRIGSSEYYVSHWLVCKSDITASSNVDIALSEGPVNLNWGPIMKTINESPHDFFQQGGWSFLGGVGGEEVIQTVNLIAQAKLTISS